MTNKQKEQLARVVLDAIGNIIEFETYKGVGFDELSSVSDEEIAAQLSKWAKLLPSKAWDTRIPQ
jgi:hypothetical protein